MDEVEKILAKEFARRLNLNLIQFGDGVLSKAIKERIESLENYEVDGEHILNQAKEIYFNNIFDGIFEEANKIYGQYQNSLPGTQSRYLSAVAFAAKVLDKKYVPASLAYQILRCIGEEDEKNFPNRYYYLRKLAQNDFIQELRVKNPNIEYCYVLTEKGEKGIDRLDTFKKLLELQEKIRNDGKVTKIVEKSLDSKAEKSIDDEDHKGVKIPKLIKESVILSENEEEAVVSVYGTQEVRITKEELVRFDRIVEDLDDFTETQLRKSNNTNKTRAYIAYAYNKGSIDIVKKRGSRGHRYKRIKPVLDESSEQG